MKCAKIISVILLSAWIITISLNYKKMSLISGYAAKHMSSSYFYTNRAVKKINKNDLNFTPVNIAKNKIDPINKIASSSIWGFFKREAIFRKGVGSVLISKQSDKKINFPFPKRTITNNNQIPYPYGNGPEAECLFKNVNYLKIKTEIDKIFEKSLKTRATLVVYKDQIIGEKYARGFNKNSILLGWSMTKSITSTLFGILQYQNKINIQNKAPIKEWANDERKNITIHNLLQMNSGLAWEEDYTKPCDATKMLFKARNMGNVQRDKKLIGKPNGSWKYSSGTTNLLSNILQIHFNNQQEYLNFWYSSLIDKIGMNSMLIETDLENNYIGSSYGWATARDWAKLGLLYLHNGNWNGTQIFDEKWVNYATTPTPTSNNSYGAQIWLNQGNDYPNAPKSMYYFKGHDGQYVFILPEQELVIVRMGLKKLNLNIFIQNIIDAIN